MISIGAKSCNHSDRDFYHNENCSSRHSCCHNHLYGVYSKNDSAAKASAEAANHTINEMKEARDQENAPYVVIYFDVPSDEYYPCERIDRGPKGHPQVIGSD